MSQYRTFTATDAVEYARKFSGLEHPETLVDALEVGDGNLNLVFKILDQQGISRVIVKQALPYVRCVGESWPLTLDRARLEAETLIEHYNFCPEHTVNVTHYDPELAVMVMEDLSDYRIWRGELVRGQNYPRAAAQLGHYLASVLFSGSDFALHAHEKKARVAQFINPEMCEITEDLFFNDPYTEHPRNDYPEALEPLVASLRNDSELRLRIASLKYTFLTHAETLLHGDIHSGSIFVTETGLKAIDAEFGYYGPMGFDMGTAIGNLLLNYCGLPGLLPPKEAADAREQRLADIVTLWQTFRAEFLSRSQQTRDIALAVPGYAELFMQKVWQDTIGFSGTELIRRTVGMSHVADISEISDDRMRIDCLRHAITLGHTLILAAAQLQDADALVARIRQTAG
ncbi:methylthioribose kinase [Tatumella morbirosei]|uniref:Methylthioribose kinase n=1 Tax=Tatumella morbirosei TaxID=642227 RepID=A0A095T2D4_9GAMM|nr:S-methyl-5-thioribose kinase [Tatumella morbirosei]KGD70892.1 methylthioribose kinase [Tatumella morbirosei]